MASTPKNPKAFLSYSHDSPAHRAWVLNLASRLRGDGVETILDQWELKLGDQIPAFMEKAVRDSDSVLIVCTPRYKERSDGRVGGVGYEGDIMTAQVFNERNSRKFKPILRFGEWSTASPSWLAGALHVDLRGDPYPDRQYQYLLDTLLDRLPTAPPVKASRKNPGLLVASEPQHQAEPQPADLSVEICYTKKPASTGERHDYCLEVKLINRGTESIGFSHVDLEMPALVVSSPEAHPLYVRERSTPDVAFFRLKSSNHEQHIFYSGDNKPVMSIPYYVDNEIYQRNFWGLSTRRSARDLFKEPVKATLYRPGFRPVTAGGCFEDFQNF